MTKTKKPADADNNQELTVDEIEIDATLEQEADAITAEIVELTELEQAQAEAEDYKDRFVRLQAEWDNYRKRTNNERTSERKRAAERLVERLLPIVDDLERAIEHSDTASEASLKEGIAGIYAKLNEVLDKEGVVVIDPVGEPFDANKHNAVSKAEDPSVPEETVTQVYQKGYELGDRVLRPAMVVVSTT